MEMFGIVSICIGRGSSRVPCLGKGIVVIMLYGGIRVILSFYVE